MIEVIDNFLDKNEIEQLYNILWYSDWYLQGTEYPNSKRTDRIWSLTKMIKKSDINYLFYDQIRKKILDLEILEKKYDCERFFINAYKYSDVLSVHTDISENGCENLSAIIYGNNEWNINWGSETIFTTSKESDAEIIKSVIPKPGRLVIFDSKIPHTGRNPSSIFPNYRYSVVYNLKLKNPKKLGLI